MWTCWNDRHSRADDLVETVHYHYYLFRKCPDNPAADTLGRKYHDLSYHDIRCNIESVRHDGMMVALRTINESRTDRVWTFCA